MNEITPDRSKEDTHHSSLVTARDLATLTPEQINLATKRIKKIRQLLEKKDRQEQDVVKAAAEIGISTSWMYELMKRYRLMPSLSSMLGNQRGVKKGSRKINSEVEKIIWEVIDQFYLTRQKRQVFYIMREIKARCNDFGLKPPAQNTVRNRIASIPANTRVKHREGGHVARDRFNLVGEGFPQPTFPLGVVQIDHSPTDIELLSEDRLPIGRAYLTLIIDVYSRAIISFIVTLSAPSALTVGLSLHMATFPKTGWLADRGLNLDWPMYGKPDNVFVDNGSDFRSKGLLLGCIENDINLEFRPVKHPSTGGTIERVISTVQKEVHQLPGTTFSNITKKGTNKPEREAVLTMPELEQIISTFITKRYHEEVHSGIGRSPRVAWDAGIFGDGNSAFRGLPRTGYDPLKFLIDFLPAFSVPVQSYGFQMDYIRYSDDRIRLLINKGDGREWLIRRDPRDLSRLYLYYPDGPEPEYWEIPYADRSRPRITLDEHRAALAYLKNQNIEKVNEKLLFEAHREVASIVENATVETKRARRAKTKVKHTEKSLARTPTAKNHGQKSSPHKPSSHLDAPPKPAPRNLEDGFDDIDVEL